MSAIQGNTEAYQFAQDWYDAFKAAGWTMMDDMVRVYLSGGKPRTGIFIRLYGETVPPGGRVTVPRDSSAEVLLESLEKLNITLPQQVQAQRYLDMSVDRLSFEVGERPEN